MKRPEKKQQRDAGILSDSMILRATWRFLMVFGWSAASWSRLSPAVALLGRSLHSDLRGQTCGRTPWRCLAPAPVCDLNDLDMTWQRLKNMGWMALVTGRITGRIFHHPILSYSMLFPFATKCEYIEHKPLGFGALGVMSAEYGSMNMGSVWHGSFVHSFATG